MATPRKTFADLLAEAYPRDNPTAAVEKFAADSGYSVRQTWRFTKGTHPMSPQAEACLKLKISLNNALRSAAAARKAVQRLKNAS